jgi:hypothetical protein
VSLGVRVRVSDVVGFGRLLRVRVSDVVGFGRLLRVRVSDVVGFGRLPRVRVSDVVYPPDLEPWWLSAAFGRLAALD